MLKLRPCHVVLHCLLLRGSFLCVLLLTDALIQIRHAHPDLLLDSADRFFLRIRKLKEVLIHGIGAAAEYLGQLLRLKSCSFWISPERVAKSCLVPS